MASDYVDYTTNNWKESAVRLMKRCTNNSIIVNYLHSTLTTVRRWHCTETSALKERKVFETVSVHHFASTIFKMYVWFISFSCKLSIKKIYCIFCNIATSLFIIFKIILICVSITKNCFVDMFHQRNQFLNNFPYSSRILN